MPNKLSAYLDLAKLQGAHRLNIKGKDGQLNDCIVINLTQSRAKIGKDGVRVNLSLSLVPNREGKDEYGQTHWICEPTTKEEREANPPVKLPILGNAREFDDGPPSRSAAPRSQGPSATGFSADVEVDEDGIPF